MRVRDFVRTLVACTVGTMVVMAGAWLFAEALYEAIDAELHTRSAMTAEAKALSVVVAESAE